MRTRKQKKDKIKQEKIYFIKKIIIVEMEC